MLKNNNALADRLNSFRTGTLPTDEEDIQLTEDQSVINTVKHSLTVQVINYAVDLAFFAARCLSYGYSLKVVFHTDWNVIAVIAVGFSIETMTTKLFSLFQKN